MTHSWELATAIAVYIIVLIVPGPNMILVFNHALRRDREAGIVSGVGFGIAATILAILSYLGISSLHHVAFNLEAVMYAISGMLLLWFSFKLSKEASTIRSSLGFAPPTTSIWTSFSTAFLLNISNPKALALLTGIYGGPLASIELTEAVFFMVFCMLLEFLWYYLLIDLFLRFDPVKIGEKFYNRLSRITNFLLAALGAFLIWQAVALFFA